MTPTEKDTETLLIIKEWITKFGWSPTVREVADSLGLAISTTHRRLDRLEELGWIERGQFQSRALRVTTADWGS